MKFQRTNEHLTEINLQFHNHKGIFCTHNSNEEKGF